MEAYNAIAKNYDAYSQKYLEYLNSIDDYVISCIEPGSSVLDLGCGDGRRLKKIMSACNIDKATAIDGSDKMLQVLRKRFIDTSYNIQTYQTFLEKIGTLKLNKFDCIIMLWNVLGHVNGVNERVKLLRNIYNLLKDDGFVLLDVNNRHNAKSYGLSRVFWRRIIDTIKFKPERGDTNFDWHINGADIPVKGHLFIRSELENMISAAGLKVVDFMTVNYKDGSVSKNTFHGQLLYKLKKET